MKRRVLVTGGAGYLGAVITERLLAAGCTVTVLDNLDHGQASLLHVCHDPRFEFVRGDARDTELLRRLVASADVILPLAAVVGAAACDQDPWRARSTNFEALVALDGLRSPQQLLVVPITNSGYGTQSGELVCTEDTPLEPISLYGRTKVDAESALLGSPNVISLRLATVFGMSPRMRVDLLVNHFVYAAVSDGYVILFEKHFKRNFIHVRDVADAFAHCIEHASSMVGRAYNAGLDDANLSKEELAQLVRKHVPEFVIHSSEIRADPDKRNYLVSNERLRQAGFAARRSLDDGIRELLCGYRMAPQSAWRNVSEVVR